MFGKNLFSKLFAQQDVEQLKFEQKLKEMTVKDVVREFEVNKENKMEIKTEMSEQELVKNEEIIVEDAPEVSEETEVEVAEAIEEVVEEQQEEVEEVTEEPKPVEEGIEPPTEQAVETLDEEEVVEEEQLEEQEEPQEQIEEIEAKEEPEAPVAEVEEVAEEVVEEQVEVQEEEQPAETEQPAEPIVVEATPQNIEVPSAINVVSEQAVEISEVKTQDLLKEIENLKAEKAENEIKIAKMELSKSVEVDFAGVPGNIEDKTNMIYEIQNSALSSEAKDFILNSLKSLSVQNLSDCEEVGHDNEVEEDEKSKENKAIKEAMLEHGLTENQAFLYVRGDRTLNEAKRVSNKVKSKK